MLVSTLAATLSLGSIASAAIVESRSITKRAIVDDPSNLESSYDYIIVGGGSSGLAVANRLTEDSSISVLVIEAGSDGEAVIDRILAPAAAYYTGIAYDGSPYDWSFYTVNQTGLGGRTAYWPRGKVLGGSSAVNGDYITRGSSQEYDAWASLQTDGLEDWSWEGLYPHMKKAENFSTPSAHNAELGHITYNTSNHGRDGPMHYSFAGYVYEQQSLWRPTLEALGLPVNEDAYGGNTTGIRTSLSAINQANWTRSYAKSGYLDPYVYRTNLNVLVNNTVTQINFGSNTTDGLPATGVSFATSANGTVHTVTANKEVILSAGVIGTPHLLQVSGIGPSALLEANNVSVLIDLPGVGEHLNDHLSAGITFITNATMTGDMLTQNATFQEEQWNAWLAGKADSLYTAPNESILYATLAELVGSDNATTLLQAASANLTASLASRDADATVLAGFEALYKLEIETLLPNGVGSTEILMTNTGTSDAENNTIVIQAALQRPLSRGTVQLQSNNIFDAPAIDPAYLTEGLDLIILREGFKYARTIANTPPLSEWLLEETWPGSSVSTDDEWDAWLLKQAGTEYHPAGSASMLPLSLGGVVNTQLKVYGTTNLRVIDTSVLAAGLSAHLNEPAYGVGEKGASIIKAQLSASTSASGSSVASSTATSTSSAAASTSNSSNAVSAESSATKSTIVTSLVLTLGALVLANVL